MSARTATCLCGACHVKIDKIVSTALCHCTTCRKRSGSAFAMISSIPDDAFHLEHRTPQSREKTNPDNGNHTTIRYCADCGCTLWAEFSMAPGSKFLRAGVLDGEDAFELPETKPVLEIFTKRRPHWLCAVEGATQMEAAWTMPKKE